MNQWIKTDTQQMINPDHISRVYTVQDDKGLYMAFQLIDGVIIDEIKSISWVDFKTNLNMMKELVAKED